mmetsp:Transcript_76970/g.215073  ORF Transcript_76970/g.215073 Transcript_76970/m.215073 type:complete len:201 (+) Transcript_76970:135-737(+)
MPSRPSAAAAGARGPCLHARPASGAGAPVSRRPPPRSGRGVAEEPFQPTRLRWPRAGRQPVRPQPRATGLHAGGECGRAVPWSAHMARFMPAFFRDGEDMEPLNIVGGTLRWFNFRLPSAPTTAQGGFSMVVVPSCGTTPAVGFEFAPCGKAVYEGMPLSCSEKSGRVSRPKSFLRIVLVLSKPVFLWRTSNRKLGTWPP